MLVSLARNARNQWSKGNREPPSPLLARLTWKVAAPACQKRISSDRGARKDKDVEEGPSGAGSDDVIGDGSGTNVDNNNQNCSEGECPANGANNDTGGGPMLGTPSTLSAHQDGDTPTAL